MQKEHDSERKFYEKRAQLTLIENYTNEYSMKIVLSDKPDLIDAEKHIGIEVTRAFYNNCAEISGLSDKCINKNISDIPDKTLNQLKKLGGNPIVVDGIYYGNVFPCVWISTDSLEKCFINKIKTINKGHYQNCKNYDLFIYSPDFNGYEQDDILKLCKKMNREQQNYKIKYRYVYIDDENEIYQCNLIEEEINTLNVNKDKLHKICEMARQYAINK